ncbi:MAG: uracil phosphoribosyltransferase [Erysipelothrix sp.]|nr:uracil phosphoribosyltransferase [Erysipelothrix sp.]
MVTVLNHPLITHKLTTLRKEETNTKDFNEVLDEVAGLMAYEITRDLPTKEVEIKTPMETMKTQVISKEVVLIPILRAGLGMVDGIRSLIPTAKVGHLGMYRDEETLTPVEYFVKLPKLDDAIVMVLDPMLATGGSAVMAIDVLKREGAKHIKLVCIVGVQEGIDAVNEKHPDVDIFLAAKDPVLNDIGYISPGLGDAGDRIFGTK